MYASTKELLIGLVVDAGPKLGYGHAVRCLRLARAFRHDVAIYPLSEDCRRFFEVQGVQFAIRSSQFEMLPPIVVTDLREAHGITASIRSQGSIHVSLHDLGLGQCRSDVAIDGSVVQLFPFAADPNRALFLGPSHMITRQPVKRMNTEDTVFVTLGGGASADYAGRIAEQLQPLGLDVIYTRGLASDVGMPDIDIERAMATCKFAISASGTALYDLLASGVPTIAVALDRLQLRTAEAFRERGAVLSAGLIDRISSKGLIGCCQELVSNRSLAEQIAATGKTLVDGKGLSRVVEIIRELQRGQRISRFTEERICQV